MKKELPCDWVVTIVWIVSILMVWILPHLSNEMGEIVSIVFLFSMAGVISAIVIPTVIIAVGIGRKLTITAINTLAVYISFIITFAWVGLPTQWLIYLTK